MARDTQFQDTDIRDIVRSYDLALVSFAHMEGGANSSFLLDTKQGRYVLTAFDDKTLADVVSVGQLLMLLAEYDFPTTRLLAPTQGYTAVMHNGKPLLVKAHIAGQVHEDLDTAMLRQAGAAMARLHQIPAPDFLPREHPYGRQLFPTVIGRGIDPGYESWLDERCAYLNQRIPPGLPTGLIHGDLFYDNVLFEGRHLKALIDFEEACHYYRVFDIGMGILGLCAGKTTVALHKAQALVAGYQQVRLLEDIEKVTLQLFVEYAAIATSYWRFWKYHVQTPTLENAEKHWQMVRLAQAISVIPEIKFVETVFSDDRGRGDASREGIVDLSRVAADSPDENQRK
jgi:homoserine kinase type II